MPASPTRSAFHELAATADLVPVSREILLDTDTAVSAFRKVARGRFSFLLESVVGGERWARYTFFGTEPRSAWRLRDGAVSTWRPGEGWSGDEQVEDPLADLERRVLAPTVAEVPGLPRFTGGWVGYFGYDIIRCIESLPDAPPSALDVPDALFVETRAVVAIDNLAARALVLVYADTRGAESAELERRYEAAIAEIDEVVDRLRGPGRLAPLPVSRERKTDPDFESSLSREAFEARVRTIQEYILAGDAFQVVLSQRLSIGLPDHDPFDVYRALRTLNPSPYLFYLEMDGLHLIGSSPEVLVRAEEGTVTVRPIAGTRPRSSDADEDGRRAEELRLDPKEVAEHLMLLDLGRNDVGRISEYGSVRVTERMEIERYSHVLHMVSSVEGRLAEGHTLFDALRATFPAGTVSGAPKVRAMEIIDELEPVRRGPYAGAVGYLAHGGAGMDLAIAIRTLLVHEGRAHVQAGAGVVADSVPSAEYEETLAKARALLRAVGMLGDVPGG